ncbi:hypothetical protein TRIUR3_30511 [Triticum urartu]|uniref:Uncharacterized protein n=1 Tax=Triticum urartu TaxID=4572 RepID=M7XDL3_TRIUA|nr:hypothetical protein TRIUR3_30511 [Triticum urartu]
MGESSALQSILYDRGALRLLDQVPPSASHAPSLDSKWCRVLPLLIGVLVSGFDVMQRKLPLEEVYIDVKDSADGW